MSSLVSKCLDRRISMRSRLYSFGRKSSSGLPGTVLSQDIWWYLMIFDDIPRTLISIDAKISKWLSGPWFQICIVHHCASMHQQQSIVVFFRAKASQKYRFDGDADSTPSSSGSVFASLSQWYEHARTVWQTLSMCGTDLLQFRTMRCQRCILLKTIRNVSR